MWIGEMSKYPKIVKTKSGEITTDKNTYEKDVYISANGEINKRKKSPVKQVYSTSHKIGPVERKKLCENPSQKGVHGTDQSGLLDLTEGGHRYLAEQGIEVQTLSDSRTDRSFQEMRKAQSSFSSCHLLKSTCLPPI
jgi:hypothetical protein